MLGALTPPGKVAQGRRLWLLSTTAFTLAGVISSAAVGALLAALGHLAGSGLSGDPAKWLVAGLAVVVALRELAGVQIPLPQMQRATNGALARRGQPLAAIVWGLDIGSFFSTWLTFSGAWWLAFTLAISADPALAMGALTCYWLGRSIAIWLGPWLIPNATVTPRLPAAWYRLHRPFQVVHAMAVVLTAAALTASA